MLRQVIQHEGLRGLYRGFTVSMLRDVPSYGIYFATYYHVCTQIEQLKQGVNVHPENASPSTQILAGGLSGTFGWMSIYYLDVVKSRMQAETAQQSPGKTWLDYAKQVYQRNGLKGFVRGLQPTLVRAFVMDAVAFYGYSSTLHLLD
ncbi:mitochondrial carrier domain-containing protein [Dunaliella salina]|uniref:Mitochondrial carrier domain-containing protein n=1 Tax=Dunaliella salina TaxID=3046 RepID=A0ABQ7H5A6_DUNSA|nr:mitochondrial carrier domain-containing protein [Dunaliella salina]|eukprot:KAF5842034.1 mitochondrial carrier domain-containing protein [Dunaliella salina]